MTSSLRIIVFPKILAESENKIFEDAVVCVSGRINYRDAGAAERIAEKMLWILVKRSPAFAYGINRNFLLRLYGIMPTRLQLFAIKCVLQ